MSKPLARLRGSMLKKATLRLLTTYYIILLTVIVNSTLYNVNNL